MLTVLWSKSQQETDELNLEKQKHRTQVVLEFCFGQARKDREDTQCSSFGHVNVNIRNTYTSGYVKNNRN